MANPPARTCRHQEKPRSLQQLGGSSCQRFLSSLLPLWQISPMCPVLLLGTEVSAGVGGSS